MAVFYADKIISKTINQKTGLPWTIEDVPTFWRKMVLEVMTKNADNG